MQVIEGIEKLNNFLFVTLSAFEKARLVDSELLSYSQAALTLAFSLFPNEEIAFQIVLDAALSVKSVAYDKSRYRKHSEANKITKVLLNKAQLFQHMIWLECQKWEKYQEAELLIDYLQKGDPLLSGGQYIRPDNLRLEELEEKLKLSEIAADTNLTTLYHRQQHHELDQKDMVMRYLKFLIQNSIDNNSFYVALVVNHMIYDYALSQIVYICAYLNPDVIEGTYLYKLKKKLIEKLKKRFHIFINWKNEADKEFFDINMDAQSEWYELVKQWSYQFIPWETDCTAKTFNKNTNSFEEHLFERLEKISNADQIEMNRTHAIVCPDCYCYLINQYIKDTALDKTKRTHPPKLAIPYFNIPGSSANRPGSRKKEIKTMINTTKDIEQEFSGLLARVAQPPQEIAELFVFADDERKAVFNLKQTNTIRLKLSEDTERVKITSHDNGKLSVLAVLLLDSEDIDRSWLTRLLNSKKEYCTTLSAGGEITFTTRRAKFNASGNNFIIDIAYKDKPTLQTGRSNLLTLFNQPGFGSFRLTTAAITAILIAGLLFFYLSFSHKQHLTPNQKELVQKPDNQQQKLDNQQQKPVITSAPQINKNTSIDTIAIAAKSERKPKPIAKNISKPPINEERTLSATTTDNIELSEVTQIYFEQSGDSPLQQQFYTLLQEGLKQEKIDLSAREDLADALLQSTLTEINGELFMEIELINRNGKTLFKQKFTGYKDVKDLVAAIISHLREKMLKAAKSH